MRRREFITLLGAVAFPIAARGAAADEAADHRVLELDYARGAAQALDSTRDHGCLLIGVNRSLVVRCGNSRI